LDMTDCDGVLEAAETVGATDVVTNSEGVEFDVVVTVGVNETEELLDAECVAVTVIDRLGDAVVDDVEKFDDDTVADAADDADIVTVTDGDVDAVMLEDDELLVVEEELAQ
jgi:hypothetical protein